jgi:hypothetical protein
MGILFDLLSFPVTGPLKGLLWIAEKVRDQAEGEIYNEDNIRGQLMELELHLDLGEITEDEYMAAEEELLDRLRAIREHKAAQAEQ